MFRRPGSAPPQISPVPANRRGGQQPGVVAGQHRHRARPGAAHGHDHAAGPARHVGAAHVAQVAADQPGAGAQADQPGRAHPPLRSWAGRPPARDTRRSAPGCRAALARSRGSGRSAGYSCGTTRRPMNRRFVRSVRRATAGQARRAPGEPLGYRRVQHHLRHRLQAQPDRVIGELARRPQQVLGPLLPARLHRRDHVPGERRRLRRHRRRPPPRDIAGYRRRFRPHEASREQPVHRNILWTAARPADLRRCVAWNQAQPSARPATGSPPSSPPAGFALPGTLTVRAYACGKPGCRCHADPPRLHGPYAEWTRKIGGKTVTRRLTARRARRIPAAVRQREETPRPARRAPGPHPADHRARQHPGAVTPAEPEDHASGKRGLAPA